MCATQRARMSEPSENAEALQRADFSIPNAIGKTLDVTVRYRDGLVDQPVVLLLHGFKGFKDWGFFPHVAEQIAHWGAISVAMNFSLNGISLGSDVFDRIGDFANNTISREVADAAEMVEAISSGMLDPHVPLSKMWNRRMYLLGHSRGGGIALLTTRNFNGRVHKTCVWNSVGRWGRYTERQENIWRDKGYFEISNQRTKQVLRMNLSYLEDIERNAERLDLLRAVAESPSDVLLIHAEQDLSVPIEAAEKLLAAARAHDAAGAHSGGGGRKVELVRIPKSGHTFGAVHPFQGTTSSLNDALQATREFFAL